MMRAMTAGIAALLAGVICALPAAAETIYKYRQADGRTVYSNRLERGLELIETFEYRYSGPASATSPRDASQSDAEGEARIKKQLDTLQAAWTEVQDATRALEAAEERLRAGVDPRGGERESVAAGASPFAPPPSPPDVGGPIPLPPSVGGVPAAASPAIGGPMSGRRGRASPEYLARIDALEADVRKARERLNTALQKYNQLR
jgi:hypothetical protein